VSGDRGGATDEKRVKVRYSSKFSEEGGKKCPSREKLLFRKSSTAPRGFSLCGKKGTQGGTPVEKISVAVKLYHFERKAPKRKPADLEVRSCCRRNALLKLSQKKEERGGGGSTRNRKGRDRGRCFVATSGGGGKGRVTNGEKTPPTGLNNPT